MLAITERHSRPAGQAGRPAAQYAHPGFIDKPEKRRRIAQETVDIYAPLAGRIGMQNMREELEDLAFAELDPEARNSIVTHFARLDMVGGDRVGRIADQIKRKLAEHGMEAWVYGRGKRPFSIWRKLQTKKLNFEQLSDIFGFRVIVGSTEDCYRALGVIHTSWQMVPERFKDFISTPKTNGYRSIHTTVIGPEKQRVEIQIRTQDMHDVAERGVAAHWRYREHVPEQDGKTASPMAGCATWWICWSAATAPEEVLENSRLAMYQDQVFCFTPKGSLISLPRGATPIDFAYAVHTDLGNTAVGAKVNGGACAAAHAAQQWRPGRNHHHQGSDAVAVVGAVCRHRPGAGGNPPLSAPCPARRTCANSARKILEKTFADQGCRIDGKGHRRGGQETAPGQGRRCLCRCRARRAARHRSAAGGVPGTQARPQSARSLRRTRPSRFPFAA